MIMANDYKKTCAHQESGYRDEDYKPQDPDAYPQRESTYWPPGDKNE